jgi:hypothetical protein
MKNIYTNFEKLFSNWSTSFKKQSEYFNKDFRETFNFYGLGINEMNNIYKKYAEFKNEYETFFVMINRKKEKLFTSKAIEKWGVEPGTEDDIPNYLDNKEVAFSKMLFKESYLLKEEKKRICATIFLLNKQFDKLLKFQNQNIKSYYDSIIKNSKEMFYRNLFTLYSLFLLFSTFSMLLTGGYIECDTFADGKVDSIPEAYAYINFNDLASSFITCFCLLMINNLNILVRSLTFHISSNKIVFQFYFAAFYFFSTLIIINIIQTLLLELYLNSNSFIDDEEEGEDNKPKEEKELVDKESDDSEDDEEEMNEMEKELYDD